MPTWFDFLLLARYLLIDFLNSYKTVLGDNGPRYGADRIDSKLFHP